MTNSLTIIPAYGRDYASAAAATADFLANKDFAIVSPHKGGRYVTHRECIQHDIGQVTIRFNRPCWDFVLVDIETGRADADI